MTKSRIPPLVILAVMALVVLSGCDFFKQLFGGDPPATPAELTVGTPTATSLTVTWKPSADATSYQLFSDVTADGTFTQKVYDGSATTYTDTGLSAPFPSFYKVRATNSAGSSDLSAAAGGMTVGTYPWSSFGSWILYATNETANCGSYWFTSISSSSLTVGASVDSWVNKAGGQYAGDIGIIFGYADSSNFWMFVIYSSSSASKYAVFQIVNTVWMAKAGYTASPAIVAGLGQSNELTVDSSYVSNTYYLDFWINSTLATTLSQVGTPLVNPTGLTGFIAEVGLAADEDFPAYPVYNMYQQVLPVAYAGSGASGNVVGTPRGTIAVPPSGPAQKAPASGRPPR